MTTTAFKVFTHDLRSPIKGGDPVWDGSLPYILPITSVDAGPEECSAGWNACAEGHQALQIAGLWPNGHPSRLFRVETDQPVIIRGDKLRATSWSILEEITDVTSHVRQLSEPFGDLADAMTVEQMAWRHALSRPLRDEQAVIGGLTEVLKIRGLKDWTLKQFENGRAAWDARADWSVQDAGDAEDARDVWGAWVTRVLWEAKVARDARDARDAREALVARNAWNAGAVWAVQETRAAWATAATWDARESLVIWYAAKMGWIQHDPMLLTTGIRDAYTAGLALAIPLKLKTLGWSMVTP